MLRPNGQRSKPTERSRHARNSAGEAETGLCLEAIGLFHDLGDPRGEAATLDSMAFAQYHLGQYAEALASFARAGGVPLARHLEG